MVVKAIPDAVVTCVPAGIGTASRVFSLLKVTVPVAAVSTTFSPVASNDPETATGNALARRRARWPPGRSARRHLRIHRDAQVHRPEALLAHRERHGGAGVEEEALPGPRRGRLRRRVRRTPMAELPRSGRGASAADRPGRAGAVAGRPLDLFVPTVSASSPSVAARCQLGPAARPDRLGLLVFPDRGEDRQFGRSRHRLHRRIRGHDREPLVAALRLSARAGGS